MIAWGCAGDCFERPKPGGALCATNLSQIEMTGKRLIEQFGGAAEVSKSNEAAPLIFLGAGRG